MATEYYVDTTFEEEETPASAKMNSFNERIKAGFQLISNAFVDMTGDDKVIDDVGRTDELKVTASSPSDMTVHVAIGLACVDGQICQVDAPVDKTIVAPTTNPRYTIIEIDENGNIKTIDGTESASPVEPDADADAMKLAAIYLPANTTQIDDSDLGYGYIIDRREWPTMTLGTGGNVGINTTSPDARLDVLETSGAQLRLTHTDDTKFVNLTLDTNHDLTIKPSSTGQIKLQPTTDSVDFFQVLDADGGTPILNVDSDNERVGVKNGAPAYDLDVTGKARITTSLGVGVAPSDSVGIRSVLTGAGKQIGLGLGNQQDYAAGVGTQLVFQVGSALSTMATIDGVCAGSSNDDGYMTLSTRKSDVLYERVRITEDGWVGILTPSPSQALEVAGNVVIGAHDGSDKLYINRYSSGGYCYIVAGDIDRDVGVGFVFQYRNENGSLATGIAIGADGKAGIGIAPSAKRLEILDASASQLRLTQTADTNYVDFLATTNGDLTITPSGDEVVVSGGDILADGGFKQPFMFMQSDVSASQSAVALNVLGLSGNTEVVLPYAGSVIAISVASNDARTAGTLTVDATVNGTPTGLQAQLDGTNTTYHSATQAKDTDTFSAGDRLGVDITTDSSWTPTTADIVVAVIIEM